MKTTRRFASFLGAMQLVTLLSATIAHAQFVTLPATVEGEVNDFVTIEAKTDDQVVKWKTPDQGLKLFPTHLLKDTKTAIVIAAQPGRYRLYAVSAKDGVPSDFAECTIVIGGAPPIPVPVPPGPPEPPPNPPEAGPRNVLIFRESANDTSAQARLFTSLQAGNGHEYLQSKGHKSFVLDVDSEDGHGNPAPIVQAWKSHIEGAQLPLLIIVDREAKKVVHKSTLAPAATIDDLLKILKENGG